MPTTVRHAEEALALRRVAIAALNGAGAAERHATPARFSQEAWSLFLQVERCAAPLHAALARGGRPADPVVDSWMRGDIQRTLTTKAQLGIISALARERSWPVVVLKGAVAAAAGEPIHLVDLDLLVRPEHAAPLAAEMRVRLGAKVEGQPSPRHLAAIVAADALPVEIHTSIDNRWTTLTDRVWSRIVPLEGFPGLWRLAPPDHALHMLAHVVIDHPDRRGRIRDTLLIGTALRSCTTEETRDIERVIERTPYAEPLNRQLAFARKLGQGARGADPYEVVAFTRFWLVDRERSRRPPRTFIVQAIYPMVWLSVIPLVAGWPHWQRFIDGLREPAAAPSELAFTAWLERHLPPIGKALRISLRALQYAGALIIALPIAREVRRAARRAGVDLP